MAVICVCYRWGVMLMDALLLSLCCLTYGLSGSMKKWLLSFFFLSITTHTQQRDVSGFDMKLCSSFMAAVVTSRYTTSGHLTSLGMGVGVGAGPLKAELFGFFHSHQRRRTGYSWMCVSPISSAHFDDDVRTILDVVRDSSPREHSHPLVCEKQGPLGDLLSGCRVKDGC